MVYLLVLLITVVTVAVIFRAFQFRLEGFATSIEAAKSASDYKTQVDLVQTLQEDRSNGRRDFNDMLQDTDIPKAEQCLVNFNVLGSRFTGYLGPFKNGKFDTDSAVLAALKMGCRALFLEIDYYADICSGYFPRLVVRDKNGANMTDITSDIKCQGPNQSNIADTCASIAKYAFSNSVANPADPLIIVLYFIRNPPNDGKSDYNKLLATYYTNVARGLKPLLPYATNILASGGNYSRQMQEAQLLVNPISTYSGQVLFFCNADTTTAYGPDSPIPADINLDYIVNLRLCYTQASVGVTKNTNTVKESHGTKHAFLETVEGYNQIPADQISSFQTQTTGAWTACISTDPGSVVPQKTMDQLMAKIGVQCVPIQLWSNEYDYMFDKEHFGKYSFIPKPENLRFTTPATIIPAKPSKKTIAGSKGVNDGSLRAPTS